MEPDLDLRRRMMAHFRQSDFAGWLGVFCVAVPTLCLLAIILAGTFCLLRWLLN